MLQRPPIALVVFSNDLDDYLSNIETERKAIEEALEHYDDTNRLKVITRSSVDIEGLFQLFNRYSGRIVLFHFAGHASGEGLQLNHPNMATMTGKAAGIAALIRREVTEGQLKLVFLNGCSTLKQVEGLKAVGVPSVIATHYPIGDEAAVNFSNIFYRTWAKADDQTTAFEKPLTTLQTAFDAALAYLKTKQKVKIERTERGLRLRRDDKDEEIPWELFTENPAEHLPIVVFKKIDKRKLRLLLFLFPLLSIGSLYLYQQYLNAKTPIDLTVKLIDQTPISELPPLSADLILSYRGKTETQTAITSEALFKNLLPNKTEKIHLSLNAAGFMNYDTIFRLTKGIVLPIKRDDTYAIVKGNIRDDDEQPVANAAVMIQNQTVRSKANGYFEIKLPFHLQRPKQRIEIYKEGYKLWSKTEPIFPDEMLEIGLKRK